MGKTESIYKKGDFSPHVLTIKLKMDGFTTSQKRNKQEDPMICSLNMKKDGLKVKVFRKTDHSIFLRIRNFIRLYKYQEKNRLYSQDCYQRVFTMIKGSVCEADMTALVIHICNNKASKHMNECDRTERRNGHIHNYSCRLFDTTHSLGN